MLQADFILGAASAGAFPSSSEPEIAFIGRSNVGKSSLLNNLVRRRKLAHVSGTPGKTQQINFFRVDDKWTFVDLPGFGYARVSKKQRREWSELTGRYLESRQQLCLVFYLVDSRHDPGEIDLACLEWLEMSGRRFAVVLTKTDKLKRAEIDARTEQLRDLLQLCKHCVDVIPHSSKTSEGRKQLVGIIKRECTT